MIQNIIEFLEKMIQSSGIFGYFWLFMGTFAESFMAPIPSELLMGMAGDLILIGTWSWTGVMFFAVMGNVTSTAIVWWLGNRYGEDFVLKWGGYVGYDKEELDQAKRLFDKWGYAIIFLCQLVPVMRSAITIPAGVLKTKLIPTLVATGSGASIWLALWTYIGIQLGANYKQILENETVKMIEKPIYILIILAFGFYIYKHFRHIVIKRSKKISV